MYERWTKEDLQFLIEAIKTFGKDYKRVVLEFGKKFNYVQVVTQIYSLKMKMMRRPEIMDKKFFDIIQGGS